MLVFLLSGSTRYCVVFTFLGKWLFVSHAGDSNSDSNGNLIKLENVTDVTN